jgi:pilus assembly protein CpaE
MRSTPDSPAPRQSSTDHRRPALIAFVTDAASERAFCDGLADVMPGGVDVRRGSIRTAIASMRKATTPKVLVVDISGEDQPLTALAQLANVVEPDVCVLVIGELDGVDFYREVTHNLGARDYLTKPLTGEKVARHFGGLVAGQAPAVDGVPGGGLVIITGVHGGVGATTLAVNLAAHFGVSMRRHTVLLDPDLHLGDASFLLNIKPGPGLRMALETPERIDALLAERAAQPAAERLHVLAGEEPLTAKLSYAHDAAASLIAALRRRYNFIVADVPFRQRPLFDDLMDLVHQRVLVMLPTLASVRATLRVLPVSIKAGQPKRPVIVLNRVGSPGSLTRRQVEDALAMKVDVAIPDQPRQVAAAATMGELAMTSSSGFRSGILELARHVAFVGLLDATAGTGPVKEAAVVQRAWRLFRRRS